MPGETSKEIGEIGEKVVSRLLGYIGWSPLIGNRDIDCHRPEIHETKTKKHGIDGMKYYRCPLFSTTQKTVVISVKYYESYPSNPSKKTREFLVDLQRALFCLHYDLDNGKKKIEKDIRDIHIRGLLFYLSHSGENEEDIITKLDAFRTTDKGPYDPVFLVDNRRASFLYSVVCNHRLTNKTDEISFSYPRTDLNSISYDKQSSGKILPIELLASGIIPIRTEIAGLRILDIYVDEPFSKESLSVMLGFAHDYTNAWASKTRIFYSSYRKIKHSSDVAEAIAQYSDPMIAETVEVLSFPINDFRKLEE